MRAYLKWLGVAMVVTGVASFPMAIWIITGPWAVLCLLLVMVGCVLLLFAPRPEAGSEAEPGGAEAQDAQTDNDKAGR
jgi:hypothetical protein